MNNDFTPRMQQILKIMARADQAVSVKSVAEEIGVSKRTVQREMEYLGRSLEKYGITFCSKAGTGVWLEGSDEGKTELLRDLEEEETLDAFDRTERRKRLILEILKDKDLKKLFYYSNLFGVSEATVSSDLEAVESWFDQFHLKIVRKQGYGVTIEGTEKNFRAAIRAFIDENIDSRMIREVYEDKNQTVVHKLSGKSKGTIYRVLDDDILKKVVNTLSGLKEARISNLTENSYLGLVLHITIAVNRMLQQEIIEDNEKLRESVQKDEDYALACRIAEALGEKFGIQIPGIETVYIYLHLKGAKKQKIKKGPEEQEINAAPEKWLKLVNELVDAYDDSMAWLLKQDDEFLQGLIAHLQPTVIRLRNEMHIANPLLEQIKREYAAIYEKCKNVAAVLEQRLGCTVPDAEIGFLAIHFGAAVVKIENEKNSRRTVRLGIVCASGIGISRLMSSKISNYFGNRVQVAAYGKSDLTPYILEKEDFFVSSIGLSEEQADILYVNPLLLERDMAAIEEKVAHYERIPVKRQEEDPFTRQLEQVHYMAVQIKGVIKDLLVMKVDNYISFEELLVAVSEKLSPYSDRRNMIQEDIRKREKLSTQVFGPFGFALLHTRTKGAVKPSFSVCLTKDLGKFYHPYFQEIDAVIVMLLPEDEHMKENSMILGYLSGMLIEEEEFLRTIRRGDKEEIRGVMSGYLKKFFNQYLNKMQ